VNYEIRCGREKSNYESYARASWFEPFAHFATFVVGEEALGRTGNYEIREGARKLQLRSKELIDRVFSLTLLHISRVS